MEPPSTASAPVAMAPGSTIDFTVKVLTPGVEVAAITLSIRFEPEFIEVVDAVPITFVPGVQIQAHPETPFPSGVSGVFTIDNEADNTKGTIRYTVGGITPASATFNLAIISFRAKETPTPVGSPTEVVFLVSADRETQVSKSGKLLLKNTEDFTGAFISIEGP